MPGRAGPVIRRDDLDVVGKGKHRYVVRESASPGRLVGRDVSGRVSIEKYRLKAPLQGVHVRVRIQRLGGWDDRVVVAQSLGCPDGGLRKARKVSIHKEVRREACGGWALDGALPARGARGCFRELFMSRKLILRRMLPLILRSGLLFTPTSPSSTLIRSARGLTMGGLACTLAPALKDRSSKKFSRSAANFRRATSKSKSGVPMSRGARMVALLRLLLVTPSRSSSVCIERRPSLESLESLLAEFWREWRALDLVMEFRRRVGGGTALAVLVDGLVDLRRRLR